MTVLVGVLVALGVLVAGGPAARPIDREPVPRVASAGSVARGGTASGGVHRSGRLSGRLSGRMLRGDAPVGDRPGLLLAQVSAALRSGAPSQRAWRSCGVAADDLGVPAPDDLTARGLDPGHVAGVLAAARLAVEIGAPLADVLDRIGAALAHEDEAAVERAAALAGPRATARLLLWLPIGGLGLGAVLGADPIGVLLDGGLGSTAFAAGVALLWVGRRWTAALITRATRAGTAV